MDSDSALWIKMKSTVKVFLVLETLCVSDPLSITRVTLERLKSFKQSLIDVTGEISQKLGYQYHAGHSQ